MDEERRGMCVLNGILLSPEGAGNPAIFNIVDGPCGHYARRDKSHMETQTVQGITYISNLKNKAKHGNREQISGCHGLRG